MNWSPVTVAFVPSTRMAPPLATPPLVSLLPPIAWLPMKVNPLIVTGIGLPEAAMAPPYP